MYDSGARKLGKYIKLALIFFEFLSDSESLLMYSYSKFCLSFNLASPSKTITVFPK